MKKCLLVSISIFLLLNCVSTKGQKLRNEDLAGIYILKSDSKFQALSDDINYSSLEIHKDGTYTLNRAAVTFTPVIEQCDYASKGKWKQLSKDVLEITSENYYQKQEGFKYELKKASKFSRDSLYIEVNLPKDFLYYRNRAVKYYFSFNYNKRLETDKSLIKISKSDYLWSKTSNSVNSNHVVFSINANISGTTLYKGRIMFEIFEEDIDTEKNNYLTITLPHFDLCFFEFEPYNQELLFVKNSKELIWQGKSWEKQSVKPK